jgi:hypothetical protein
MMRRPPTSSIVVHFSSAARKHTGSRAITGSVADRNVRTDARPRMIDDRATPGAFIVA